MYKTCIEMSIEISCSTAYYVKVRLISITVICAVNILSNIYAKFGSWKIH